MNHGRGLVSAQRAKLSVRKLGVSALRVAAVPKPHELLVRIEPGPGTVRRDPMAEVVLFPGKMHFAPAIRRVPHNDERPEPRGAVEARN